MLKIGNLNFVPYEERSDLLAPPVIKKIQGLNLPPEEAVRLTGMEYGAITPLGLPPEWPILIDSRVAESERVIIGSGLRASKLSVPGSFLSQIPQATVLANLAVPKQS